MTMRSIHTNLDSLNNLQFVFSQSILWAKPLRGPLGTSERSGVGALGQRFELDCYSSLSTYIRWLEKYEAILSASADHGTLQP